MGRSRGGGPRSVEVPCGRRVGLDFVPQTLRTRGLRYDHVLRRLRLSG
ncbi:hypothetical protein HMPREF9056_03059 [Actinomyces sp. oral taxon 170 str. F0386]|nr:hypothetical protein HMPREF9056_03059 [Actinomyces sp. oral taxon 170 str. F0386]